MIEIIPSSDINTKAIQVIKSLTSLSIGEIKTAAKSKLPILSIDAFTGDWETNRSILSQASILYLKHRTDLFYIQLKDSENTITRLSPEGFIDELKSLRATELQTQRDSDLENGYIKSPSEFVAHDADWI